MPVSASSIFTRNETTVRQKLGVRGPPVIWSDGVTVEVRAIYEETRSLDHILCDHTQAVQNIT